MMRCDDSRLQRLLTVDEASSEYRTTAAHLETCAHCQTRLLQLSADQPLVDEVRDALRERADIEPFHGSIGSSVLISAESSGHDDGGAECEPISLDFLSAPSHPEMLGRIGRYEVERIIGSGGMGIVLKGFDTELHRVVAIKVLKPHLAANGAARRRFAREARSAAAVVHEHVIPIYDVDSENDTPFLVMKYVPGQSLQARVDERGPLEPREVLRIARQAAAGLAAAHTQGMVHRDVKPANILMEQSVERVLISDFGLARTADDATLTRTGIVTGTPHYMSPEQAGGRSVDQRSDLFSLGSVIYFMCTGRPPFRAEGAMAILNRICHDAHRPVDEINCDVPAELAEVVDRLLAKDPGHRFANSHEVVERLESILVNLQNGRRSPRLRWRRRWSRWGSAIRPTLGRLLVMSGCLLAGIGLASWHWRPMPVNRNAETAGDGQTNTNDGSSVSAIAPGDSEAADSSTSEARVRSSLDGKIFVHELEETRRSLDEIEASWHRPSLPGFRESSADFDWRRELNRIDGELQLLEKSSRPESNIPPVQQSTTKRINQ